MNFSFLFYFLIFLVLMIIYSFILLLCFFLEKVFFLKKRIRYRVAQNFFKVILKISRLKVSIKGKERIKQKPYLILVNHNSILDIVLMMAVFPNELIFMPKDSLFKIFYFGQIMRGLGYIPIYRKDLKKTMDSLKKAEQSMKQNNISILLFPEGTRSNGELLPFKNGFIRIMKGFDEIDVLPIVIKGAEKIIPKKSLKFNRSHLSISFLDSVRVQIKDLDTKEKELDLKEKLYLLMKKELDFLEKT